MLAISMRLALAALLLFVLLPGPVEAIFADYERDLEAPLSSRGRAQYHAMAAHFREPFDGYGITDVGPDAFAAIFLSNAALGFMNVSDADPRETAAIRELLDEVTRRALSASVSPYGVDPQSVRALGDENLYLSHLSIILGARRHVGGDDRYDAFHRRVVTHLAQRSLLNSGLTRSYPGSARFPADQSVTLASLYLYDRLHQTSIAERPIAAFLRTMRARYIDRATGLYQSSVTPSFRYARIPRGCALSFTTLYLAQFAPDEAREQYALYRTHYLIDRGGLGGFREFPEDRGGMMDADSGPIVLGMGVAATGFGIGAARIQGDEDAYGSLLRTAATVGLPTVLGEERVHRSAPLLGEAILFHGLTARRWDGTRASDPYEARGSFPGLPVTVVLLIAGLLAWNVRGIVRRTRGARSRLTGAAAPRDPSAPPARTG